MKKKDKNKRSTWTVGEVAKLEKMYLKLHGKWCESNQKQWEIYQKGQDADYRRAALVAEIRDLKKKIKQLEKKR